MVAAIIQARMNSTRLPGKVLLPIKGRPVIDYLFRQLSQVKKLDKIILATTSNREDVPLVDYAKENNIPYYTGSESDVLDRYYQTASKFKIQNIMRITGDCPLLDPDVCIRLMELYFEEKADIAHTGSSFAEGLDCEIFSYTALKEAFTKATLKSEREHVTMFLYNHPGNFKISTLENHTDDSKYRYTLDQKEDYHALQAIIEGLDIGSSTNYSAQIINTFLEEHPEIYNINANIIRNEGLIKSLEEDEAVEK
jgi:spore coat polysaccharide biosynthesis protein SpsF